MIKGIVVVAVAGLTVAAVAAVINDGTVIRLLGGVACSDSQEFTCGTHSDLVAELDRVKREASGTRAEASNARAAQGARIAQLETKVEGLEAEPTFPADWNDLLSHYTWSRDRGEPRPDPVQMIPADEGFCFLTRIEGTFEGDKEWADIEYRSGLWVLNGGPGRPLTAHASCWSFPEPL